jgi:copper chaperone NosL
MKKTFVVWLLGLLLLTACAPATPTEPGAPEIAYGHDVCEACGMIIDDARFAAAFVTSAGKAHKFESIGDMIAWQMDHPNEDARAWFVHDYATETWIRAETAYFVLSDQIQAPMPPGLVAYADQTAAAQRAQALGAAVLNFDETRAAVHMIVHGGQQVNHNQ